MMIHAYLRLAPRLAAVCHLSRAPVAVTHLRSFNFLSRPSTPKASPIATSSDVTLEDFPLVPSSDPIIASLTYATDTELIDAVLTEPPPKSAKSRRYVSPYDLDWKSSIDPAFAYLALRTRPTFNRFIEHIRPRVRVVYDALRSSGMHQLFASDVLMRSGDSIVLRELLEIDGLHRAQWRASATVSIYRHIQPSLASRKLKPLSPHALKAVARALIAEQEAELLPGVFDAIFTRVPWSKAEAWDMFAIILYMARAGEADAAASMLSKLIEAKYIPKSALGRSDTTHPEAKTLVVQSVIVRCALEMGLFEHIRIAADDLLATLARSKATPTTSELILELCRTSIVGCQRDQVVWAGSFLLRYAHSPGSPPLPSSIINTYMDVAPTPAAVEFYMSLPQDHGRPSPKNIVRIALARPKRLVLLDLLEEVRKTPDNEFIAQRPVFIAALVKAGEREAVEGLYNVWASQMDLSPSLVISLVKLFGAEKVHRESHVALLGKIINGYKHSVVDSATLKLVLARAYLAVEETELARETVAHLNSKSREVATYVQQVIQEDPADAYLLLRTLHPHGSDEDFFIPTNVVVAACYAGHWDALDRLKSDGERDTAVLVSILKGLRSGRVQYASRRMSEMRERKEKISVDLVKAFVQRASLQGEWGLAVSEWNAGWRSGLSEEERAKMLRTGMGLLQALFTTLEEGAEEYDAHEAEAARGFVGGGIFGQFTTRLTEMDTELTETSALAGLVRAIKGAVGREEEVRHFAHA